ncbi:hypothetical protein [Pelagibaculum spongiae]|uniref:hypothetical protein n=1 Tax=Pelagibaculum spongiae TaxID=2080658 RepID=UPI001057DD16|nr:hypothetical protein [Pelagibaculum spongiae]
MTHTVTKVVCSDCNQEFPGVLHGLFDLNKRYAAECPECNNVTIFNGVSDFIDTEISSSAVEIKCI